MVCVMEEVEMHGHCGFWWLCHLQTRPAQAAWIMQEQPGCALQVPHLPYNPYGSTCAENRESHLHKNQMFFAAAEELPQRIMLAFCRFSSISELRFVNFVLIWK